MGIKAKILFPTITLALLVAAAILVSNIVLFADFVDDSMADEVNTASDAVLYALEGLKARTAVASFSIAQDREVAEAVAGRDRDALISRIETLQERAGTEFYVITDEDGVVILRTHRPEDFGDSVTYQEHVAAALAGEYLTAIEDGAGIRLSVRSGSPIFDDGGALVGCVSVGFRLDTEQFVDSVKKILGCELSILLGDKRVSTTILTPEGTRAIDTIADPHVSEVVLAGDQYIGPADMLGRIAMAHYSPIAGADGRVLGMIFVGQYMDETRNTIQAFVRIGLIITLIMLAFFIALMLVITGRIIKPIRAMTRAASALAAGDIDIDVEVETKDEMRTLADAFNDMIQNTRLQARIIDRIADGDPDVAPKARSAKDLVNRSLAKLNDKIKEQAAAIKEEYERIKLMLDSTPLAARLWNRDCEMIDCNEAGVKLFNLKDKQECIDRYFDLCPEFQSDGMSTRDKLKLVVDEAFEKGECTFDWMYRLLDGTPVPSEVTLVRLPYNGDYVVAGYSRDLREQKKMMAALEAALEDAKEANNAKSSFLAQMSHEMRTPLNAVIGLSELTLGEENLSRGAEANLEKIFNAGSTILSIVNDILDISKIESGKFEIYPVQYDTPSLINDSITLNIMRIEEKAITFKLYVDENLPGTLFGDDLRVKQIFNNLLSNAFKYTLSGVVEWRVTFERDGNNIWLISSVRDTGIGIKPEDMQKLFSDYNQVDVKTNRKIGGTGLGLAITKRLAEMMDGSITVESEYGKGTAFHVRLRQGFVSERPIGKAVAESLMSLRYTLSKRARNTKLARINLSYAHVLVVDDIVTNLDVVKGMLKPYEVSVDCATSGRQAIDMVRNGNPRYNAIFMDHMMPGMDGIEAARIIRELGTEYARDIPIIALTANAIVGNEKMFLNQGFQAFISKPIEMMKLDAVLRRWVRDKNLEEDLDGGETESAEQGGGETLLGEIVINGVDTRRALERFGGNNEIFVDVLRSYAVNTRPLLENLDEYLEAGNLEDYGIVVHGIKGSSYSIVAQSVGKLAEALEYAAKAGDIEKVRQCHGEFRAAAESLLAGIKTTLEHVDAGAEKPAAAAPDESVLEELRAACGAFDMDRVDRAMSQLEMYRYERGGKLVEWLREQVNNMMFEEISGGRWPFV